MWQVADLQNFVIHGTDQRLNTQLADMRHPIQHKIQIMKICPRHHHGTLWGNRQYHLPAMQDTSSVTTPSLAYFPIARPPVTGVSVSSMDLTWTAHNYLLWQAQASLLASMQDL